MSLLPRGHLDNSIRTYTCTHTPAAIASVLFINSGHFFQLPPQTRVLTPSSSCCPPRRSGLPTPGWLPRRPRPAAAASRAPDGRPCLYFLKTRHLRPTAGGGARLGWDTTLGTAVPGAATRRRGLPPALERPPPAIFGGAGRGGGSGCPAPSAPQAPPSGPGRERSRRGGRRAAGSPRPAARGARQGRERRAEGAPPAPAGADEGEAAGQGSPSPSAGRDGERSERFYLLLFLSSPELAAEEEEEQQEEEEAAPGRQVQQPPRCPGTQRHVPPAARPPASAGEHLRHRCPPPPR